MIRARALAVAASVAMMGQAGAAPQSAAAPAPVAAASGPKGPPLPCPQDPRAYYPPRALDLGKGGYAVIRCTVGEDGRFHDCSAISEDPVRYGFSYAAVQMSCLLTPQAGPDGKVPAAGQTVDTRVVFTPPKQVCRQTGPRTMACTIEWPK